MILLLVVSLIVSGCNSYDSDVFVPIVASPLDGFTYYGQLSSTRDADPILVAGLTDLPNQTVYIQVYSRFSWHTIANTTTALVPGSDFENYYEYRTYITLRHDDVWWADGDLAGEVCDTCPAKARLRVVTDPDLPEDQAGFITFNADAFSCFNERRQQGSSIISAEFACGSGTTVTLNLPRAQTCLDTVYLGHHPDTDDDPGWINYIQGVAHDNDHWFFTTHDIDWLLKFPVSFNLATTIDIDHPPAEVQIVGIPWQLTIEAYDHFGDLDQVGGFLFIPMEDNDFVEGYRARPAIAVFRASDLTYIGKKVTAQAQAGWVAYNPHLDLLYSSNNNVSDSEPLYRYTVDFDTLRGTRTNRVEESITFLDRFHLLEADGSDLNPKIGDWMQGGVFTPWGDLYIVSGRILKDPEDVRGGIHLFGADGRLKAESQNGSGDFNFEYDPYFTSYEEPEGADWWNQDTGVSSPGITGQLHVILLDIDTLNKNDVEFKHYEVTTCEQ